MSVNYIDIRTALHDEAAACLNPIPTSQGRNQPLYERHMTKSGRNRVKGSGQYVRLLAKTVLGVFLTSLNLSMMSKRLKS